jgi:hypothetical protein
MMFFLAVICFVYRSPSAASFIVWTACVLALWPLKLKGGNAGQERLNVIRTSGLWIGLVLLICLTATDFISYHRFNVSSFVGSIIVSSVLGAALQKAMRTKLHQL